MTANGLSKGDIPSSRMTAKRRSTIIRSLSAYMITMKLDFSRKLGLQQADLSGYRGDVILKSLPEGIEAAQVDQQCYC